MTKPIGPLIAELRISAGLSQQQLADRLNVLTGKALTRWEVSRWESGRRIPVADLPALATTLGVPLAVLEEAAEKARALRTDRPGPADARALAAVLDAHRRLEDVAGATAVLPAAQAHQRATEKALLEARGEARQRLTLVAASSAQFAGWLHSALRQFRHAGRLYDLSLRLALEADDQDASATALSMRGHLAWLQRDTGTMLASTGAARRLAQLPATRAITAQQQARGLALRGEERAALVAMDEAEQAYDADGRPGSAYFYDRAMLTMQRGVVLHFLGRHAQAAELLAEGLALMPDEVADAEWLAWYGRLLADAQAGHPSKPTR
ncbi:helix-turn-helix domain-containing protein [Actinomadura hibisca]|uniref:helix-turn-helix domain-containing protein n=1 Tax=Actinomadura hibisca TaxID=68565 RepID=UPI00082DB986|nr:helix-turn-helix transcriptional regulator [Actinomadura hibisca]